MIVPSTDAAGFGDWLYLWLHAYCRTRAGFPTFVQAVPGMDDWLEAFPVLREFTVSESDLNFRDRRERNDAGTGQGFGVDFSIDELEAFVRAAILPWVVADRSDTLVIYLDDGSGDPPADLDMVAYVAAAIDSFGSSARTLVVSADENGFREILGDVLSARTSAVDYLQGDQIARFRSAAGARRMVGTNSTTSYWAAYAAGVAHHDATIVMPRAAVVSTDYARRQLDSRWMLLKGFL